MNMVSTRKIANDGGLVDDIFLFVLFLDKLGGFSLLGLGEFVGWVLVAVAGGGVVEHGRRVQVEGGLDR